LFTKVFEQKFLTHYEHSNFAIEEKQKEKQKGKKKKKCFFESNFIKMYCLRLVYRRLKTANQKFGCDATQ